MPGHQRQCVPLAQPEPVPTDIPARVPAPLNRPNCARNETREFSVPSMRARGSVVEMR